MRRNSLVNFWSTTAQRIWKSAFIRSVLLLMSGTTAAQVIIFAISPLLTRLYSPQEFGLFATYTAVVAIVGSLMTGQYELGVVVPKSDQTAIDLVFLSALLAVVSSSIVLIVLVMFQAKLAEVAGFQARPALLYALPVSIFLAAINLPATYWNIRNRSFSTISAAGIAQSGSAAFAQAAFGWMNLGTTGLIVGYLLGQLVGAVLLMRTLAHRPVGFSGKRLIAAGKRYRGFPKYMLVAGLVNRTTANAPLLMLRWAYSPSVAGLFGLSQRVVQTPMTIIGGSVASVFVQRASELVKTDPFRLRRDVARMALVLLGIGALPTAVLVLAGPPLFSLVFGPEWQEAGRFSQILAIYLWVQFAFSPLSPLFNVLERQRLYQRWEWLRLALCTIGLALGTALHSSLGAVVLFSLAMAISYLVMGYLSLRILNQRCERFRETRKAGEHPG